MYRSWITKNISFSLQKQKNNQQYKYFMADERQMVITCNVCCGISFSVLKEIGQGGL